MWLEFLQSNRYKLLLATLMMCFIVVPTIFEVANLHETRHSQWLVVIISALLLAIATFAVSNNRRTNRTCLMLMLASIVIEILSTLFATSQQVGVLHHSLRIIFFSFVIMEILKNLFRPTLVTFDTISASLCVYLLIGALWANFYAISEIVSPDAIVIISRQHDVPIVKNTDMTISFRMLYFSLVTLSTVGYGDVIPLSPMARMLAVSEAIIGQIYLLVMVSRLVGIHVAQAITPVNNKVE